MTVRNRGGWRSLVGAAIFLGALAMVNQPGSARAADDGTPGVFSVRKYGAAGDGKTLDTAAINQAIEACAKAGGGQVRLTPGTYLSGTVVLKSNVTLKLDAGARLVGSKDLEQYRHFTAPAGTPEARWGKWHRALILGVGVANVTITGRGVIDGNKVFDPRGEEKMRGPHTIILGNSRNVTIRDVSMTDSANYAIMIEFSSQVEVRNVKVTGGWDGVHFRGWKNKPCRDLSIVGCQFFTGDDSIAGRYARNLLITGCVVNSSCNGIRIIGPVKGMIVHDCLFYGPGVHPHRTQDRHNMLSGIILQPGAWDACEGALDDVLISNVTMKNVQSPVTIFLRRAGNTAGNITVSRLTATGVYRAAASVESWTETPVGRVVFRDVSVEYAGGGAAKDARRRARPPGVDARPLPAWGLYARNVRELVLEGVRLGCAKKDLRPALIADGVKRLKLEDLRLPPGAGAAKPIVLRDVGQVDRGSGEAPAPTTRPGKPARAK
jgi:hypothetical protein